MMLTLAALSCAIGLGGMCHFASLGHADDSMKLVGNHPAEAESFSQIGATDSTASLPMQIRFALRHHDALAKLLAEQQNPAAANYHKWLTTDQFQRRFGPSNAETEAVAQCVVGEGASPSEGSLPTYSHSTARSRRRRVHSRSGSRSLAMEAFVQTLPIRSYQDDSLAIIGSVEGMDNMAHAAPDEQAARSSRDLA